MAYYASIESFSKDIQHRAVFREHLGHEMRDPTLLGNDRQALDEDRPQAAAVEVISNLDRDFSACLVEIDVGGVPYEHALLVMGNEPIVPRVGGGRQVRSGPDVHRSAEEPQATRLQTQPREKRAQRRLTRSRRRAHRDPRAVTQPDELYLRRIRHLTLSWLTREGLDMHFSRCPNTLTRRKIGHRRLTVSLTRKLPRGDLQRPVVADVRGGARCQQRLGRRRSCRLIPAQRGERRLHGFGEGSRFITALQNRPEGTPSSSAKSRT